MIELFSSPSLKKLAPKIQNFLKEEIIPNESMILGTPFLELEGGFLQEKRQQVKALGWWAPHLPVEEGGLGLTLVEFALVSEILAWSPVGHYIFNCQAPDIGNMELLEKYAHKDLKNKYLRPLHEGAIRSCFSMTEPEHAGSNPTLMSTTAVSDGDEYVINGHKWFTSSADGSAFAVAMVITDPENPNPYKRASMIIVPTDNPGFELVRNIPIMGDAGEGYMSHAEVRYNDCRVPKTNMIHEEGSGFLLAQERLGPGRIHHCMRWIGISERALDMMCKRVVERKLDNSTFLAEKQSVQNWIAESRAEINAARYMVLHTAHKIESEGASAARQEISTIKFYVADVLQKVLDRAIQSHGALGMTDDTMLSWWYRHERGARIYDGPDEVHKSALARNILKAYGLDIKKKS
ncbi:MAG: acyl-CoA dehydrogenase family protein [Cyclobacteriaceae bacterium]